MAPTLFEVTDKTTLVTTSYSTQDTNIANFSTPGAPEWYCTPEFLDGPVQLAFHTTAWLWLSPMLGNNIPTYDDTNNHALTANSLITTTL
jgi:hypothetical protein